MNEQMEAAVGNIAVAYSGESILVTGCDHEAGAIRGHDPWGRPIVMKWEDVSVIFVQEDGKWKRQ